MYVQIWGRRKWYLRSQSIYLPKEKEKIKERRKEGKDRKKKHIRLNTLYMPAGMHEILEMANSHHRKHLINTEW